MRYRVLIFLVGFVYLTAGDLRAQIIYLDVHNSPLREALLSVRDQGGIDVVFSEGLVDGRSSTCRYEGADPAAALACVLTSSGLTAERVRRKQYVVVGNAPSSAAPEPARATLSGFVKDAGSGEVLPGAHVFLVDLQIGTVTNAAGYFALPSLPIREYDVRLSYLGYTPMRGSLEPREAHYVFELEPTTLEGESIVVEDDHSDLAAAQAVPGALAEPVSRLEALPSFPGEADLFHALEWFPGIRKSGEVSGGLIIRGAAPDQNLYLLDGAPVYHPWHAFSLISTFQTETFKNINLYRDAFPSQFGGRLAAVLEAHMKDGTREKPRVLVGLSPLSGRFVIETPATRNSSFMLAGRRSYVDKLIGDEHPVVGTDGRRDTLRTGYYFYDTSAKYTWRLSTRDRISISYYHGGDDLDLRLPFEFSLDFSSWLRPAELFFEVAHNWENRLLSARFQRVHSDRLFVTTTAYASSYTARESAFLRPTTTAALVSDYSVDLNDLGVKVDIDYFKSLSHQMQFGLETVFRGFDSALDATVRRSPGSVDETNEESISTEPEVTVYGEDVWKLGKGWTLTSGLRLSFFGGGAYADVSPKISMQYVVDPAFLTLRTGVSRNVQYLHRLRDRFAFTYDLVSSRWIPADENVLPSAAVNISGGFLSRPARNVTLRGDAYFREVEDMLLPEDALRVKDGLLGPGIDVAALLGQYVTSDGRSWGVELDALIEADPWNLHLSYAGGKSLTRAPSQGEVDLRPSRYDVPYAARAVLSRTEGKWDFTASADVRSGYPITVPVAQYIVGDPLDEPVLYLHRPKVNNGRLPAYMRADLAARRRFTMLGAKCSAELHIYNALNRRNLIARHYIPDAAKGIDVQERRGLPILPIFELQMEL